MATKKTHTAIVIRKDGPHKVRVHQTATTWVVSGQEFYYRDSGARVGAPGRGRIELDSIREIVPAPAKAGA